MEEWNSGTTKHHVNQQLHRPFINKHIKKNEHLPKHKAIHQTPRLPTEVDRDLKPRPSFVRHENTRNLGDVGESTTRRLTGRVGKADVVTDSDLIVANTSGSDLLFPLIFLLSLWFFVL